MCVLSFLFRELCGLFKHSGGAAVSAAALVEAAKASAEVAMSRHAELSGALARLEISVENERSARLLALRSRQIPPNQPPRHNKGGDGAAMAEGVDRSDPVLSYGLVHKEVFSRG
jgi:hypothetical protein